MYFNIVQPLVCKTVTRFHLASLVGQALLMKMLITLEPCGIFSSKFVYINIVQMLVCRTVTRLHRAYFWPVKRFSEKLIILEPHGCLNSFTLS